MNSKKIILSLVIIALSLPLAACGSIQIQQLPKALTASGTIAADTTRLAPEVGGKILEIKVNKGDAVKAGDVVFTLDAALLQAQRDQSAAAVQVAQAAVDAAKQKLANAQAQVATGGGRIRAIGNAGVDGVPMPNIPQAGAVWEPYGTAWSVSTSGPAATPAKAAFRIAQDAAIAAVG